jgi:hypothetical protein
MKSNFEVFWKRQVEAQRRRLLKIKISNNNNNNNNNSAPLYGSALRISRLQQNAPQKAPPSTTGARRCSSCSALASPSA